MKTHKDLEVWKKSIVLVTALYQHTKSFPKDEVYGLIQQIRRSAVSIPSNIAEGAARNHKTENIQFLYIALGSLSELETQWLISKNLGYLNAVKYTSINDSLQEIRRMLIGLIKHLKS